MDKVMAKRVYTSPRIIRVQLSPEQAVLSQCSVNATTMLRNILNACDSSIIGDKINCRRSDDGGARDSAAPPS